VAPSVETHEERQFHESIPCATPRSRPHCVRWGPRSPPPKGHSPPLFGPCLLWPNGWMNHYATWYKGRPRSLLRCVTWGSSAPPPKRARLLWPNGRPRPISATAVRFYFVAVVYSLSFFFLRLFSPVADWMSTVLLHVMSP